MKSVSFNVGGKPFACRPTMGAFLRFKRETGKEVSELDSTNLSDLCTYLWCCVVSAANADGKEFDLSLLDFADRVDQSDLLEWAASLSTESSAEGQDKKKAQSQF